jgi:hypothetical protein
MTERGRPLTMRLLRGMQAALALASAGGEEDLCGNDSKEARYLLAASKDALAWVNEQIEDREARGVRERTFEKSKTVHIRHLSDHGYTMCGRLRNDVDNHVGWEEDREVMFAAASCGACRRAYDAGRQREDDRAADADARWRAQHGG